MGALPAAVSNNVVLPPHLAHLHSQAAHQQHLQQQQQQQHLQPPPHSQSAAAVQAAVAAASSLRATPSPSSSSTAGRLTPTSVAALLHQHQQQQQQQQHNHLHAGAPYSQPPPPFASGPPPLGLSAMHASSSASPAPHMSLLHNAAVAGQQPGQPGRPLFSRERKMDSLLHNLNAFGPSEFPSLGQNSVPNPSLSARPNYVGMVKQPAVESSEFTMSHEDFPALPGSAPSAGGGGEHHVSSGGPPGGGNDRMTNRGLHQVEGLNAGMGVGTAVSQAVAQEERTAAAAAGAGLGQGLPKKGIQTSPDGSVKNIPNSMVTDQFGMIGLLTFIRAAETDPNLVSLALGADLTTLGLNLNSEVGLYPTFGGPWADTPCRPQDIDYHVPHEYLTNQAIRDKLAPVKLNRYNDDVLFYMFYTNVGDVLQLAAAAELYNRDWRYHRDDRIWITRAPGMAPSEQTNTYERGTYFFFDVNSWRKISRDFHLDYDKLEDRPSLPQNLVSGGGSATAGQQQQQASPGAPVPDVGRPGQPSPSMSF